MTQSRITIALAALCLTPALPLAAQQPSTPPADTARPAPQAPARQPAAAPSARPTPQAPVQAPSADPRNRAGRRADTVSTLPPPRRLARPVEKKDTASIAWNAAAAALAPDLAERLEAFVRLRPDAPDRTQQLNYLRTYLGSEGLRDQLSLIAEDLAEPPTARATALITIGEEHPANLGPMALAQDDPDPTVRAAAAIALRPVLADPLHDEAALVLLRRALHDTVPAVASRALEALGDRDAAALRDFLADKPPASLAPIARQLLGLAENGGAALAPVDSTGGLARESAGVTLRYAPTRRWPDWEMSVGTLTARKGSSTVELARAVEVVRNVIPAAVSADGRYVAYETDRHVHVRDLVAGADRDVGVGIAPRGVPIAPGFVFLRQTKVTHERDRDVISYALDYAPYAGGAEKEIGNVAAFARQGVAGNASGARWARVVESAAGYMLTGDALGASVEIPGLAQPGTE